MIILNLVLQAVAGLLADARQIVEHAREEAANYRSNYGSPIPLQVSNLVAFIPKVPLFLKICCQFPIMKFLCFQVCSKNPVFHLKIIYLVQTVDFNNNL